MIIIRRTLECHGRSTCTSSCRQVMGDGAATHAGPAQSGVLLVEISLCLSRACLGKLINLSIKSGPKKDRRRTAHSSDSSQFGSKLMPPTQKRLYFLNFSYVCPEPVLVK
jgi:hypothetical protein